MTATGPSYLEVKHRLPGRLRIEVRPRGDGAVAQLVGEAGRVRGVTGAELGASGRNMVVRYRPGRLAEETLLTRLALALSAHRGYGPVRLIREQERAAINSTALAAGAMAGAATLLGTAAPGGALAMGTGWIAALATMGAVGESVLGDLGRRGKPRPEALALAHLVRRLGSVQAGSGALLTWLLYFGGPLTERLRGARPTATELRPVLMERGVGDDDEGTHMEIVTRPVKERGAAEGSLLSPATVISAALGSLAYALKQGMPADQNRKS